MSAVASERAREACIPGDLIPARIIERLTDAGIRSLADWKRLGRRRKEIFGVTPHWIAQLDELAGAKR
jgi:hypothetical protein